MLLDLMKEQELIEQRVFSIFFADVNSSEQSVLTFGGFNTSQYAHNNPVNYIPLASDLPGPYWGVELRSLLLDSHSLYLTWNTAIIATEEPLICMPAVDFQGLINWFRSYGSCDSDGEYLWCECEGYDKVSGYPDLGMDFRNYSLTLTSEEYMRPYGLNGEIYCMVIIKARDLNYWVLGSAFLRKFYSIYDLENMRIGLASTTVREDNILKAWVVAIVAVGAIFGIGLVVLGCLYTATWKRRQRSQRLE